MQHGFVCAGCQEFLVQPDKAVTDPCRVTREGRTIVLSAESGCLLCKALVRYLHRRRGRVDSCWEIHISFSADEPDTILIDESGEYSLQSTTHSLPLLPTSSYSVPIDWFYQRLEFQVSQSNPSPDQLALPTLPENTSDRRCMAQASAWFEKCSETHKRCNQLSNIQDVETMPSRLLAVSTQTVKVVAPACAGDIKAPVYMTISHKWQNPMPKLLQCNIKKLEWGVNVFEFPQLFQDAFTLAKALQIPYVWIDALCIIQDDEADKASEISRMDHIYQNAVLNVGATGAADAARPPADSDWMPDSATKGKCESEMHEESNVDCSTDVTNDWRLRDQDRTSAERDDWFALQRSPASPSLDLPGFGSGQKQPQGLSSGLFATRDPLVYSPLAVTIKRKGREYSGILYDGYHADDFQGSALFKRGWVLQERLLSPRTVCFGEQMVWECSELVACETFPFGFPWYFPESNLRLGRIFTEYNESTKQYEQHKAWLNVVKAFSKCQLTYDSDFFPALSGLAHHFQVSLQDEYCAGLWRNDFIAGLCWFRDDQELNQYSPFPNGYRGKLSFHHTAFAPPLISLAPSWSWASVKFPVNFIDLDYPDNSAESGYTCIGRIEEIDVTPSGPNLLGCISSARVHISGHLRKGLRQVSERNIRRSWEDNAEQHEWFDTGYGGKDFLIRDMSAAYFLLLVQDERTSLAIGDDHYVCIKRLIGIIVEPVDESRTTWRRIGAFDHPHPRWMGQKGIPDYPEFRNWDPNNYEKHAITLI